MPDYSQRVGDISRVAILGINFPPETTGIAPYTGAAAAALREHGWASRVVTAHPHYPEWTVRDGYGGWSTRENIAGVPVTRVSHYVPERPTGVRRLLSEISFGLRLAITRLGRPRALLFVSPALFSTAIGVAAAKIRTPRTPKVVWVQDIYSLGIEETGQGGAGLASFMTRIESATLRAADHVIVIHDRFKGVLVDKLGVPAERITVIRNWTHLKPTATPDVAATRAGHGWGSDETVVLHSGNMGAKQALGNVIDAAREADERGLPVRFVLVGNGSERDRLITAAEGVKRIQFIGSLDDAAFQATLASADILLVNEKEGVSEMAVPSKLTSYFNAGRPVIAATDPTGITAAEVDAAQAGVVVPAGQPALLLEAAWRLRDDPRGADRLGANGLAFRHTVLDESHAVESLAALLDRLTTVR